VRVVLISVAVRSKAHVYVRLIAGIAGSNLAEGMDVCCVGSSICDELITHSVESYWACASVCDL
jgi:hypothetical protein